MDDQAAAMTPADILVDLLAGARGVAGINRLGSEEVAGRMQYSLMVGMQDGRQLAVRVRDMDDGPHLP